MWETEQCEELGRLGKDFNLRVRKFYCKALETSQVSWRESGCGSRVTCSAGSGGRLDEIHIKKGIGKGVWGRYEKAGSLSGKELGNLLFLLAVTALSKGKKSLDRRKKQAGQKGDSEERKTWARVGRLGMHRRKLFPLVANGKRKNGGRGLMGGKKKKQRTEQHFVKT